MMDDTELLGRIETANGPNLEIDAEVGKMAGWEWVKTQGSFGYWRCPDDFDYTEFDGGLPPFSGSVDAALALVENSLGKHWCWEMKSAIEFRCTLWTLEPDYDDRQPPTGHSAANQALSVLAAFVRAKSE